MLKNYIPKNGSCTSTVIITESALISLNFCSFHEMIVNKLKWDPKVSPSKQFFPMCSWLGALMKKFDSNAQIFFSISDENEINFL